MNRNAENRNAESRSAEKAARPAWQRWSIIAGLVLVAAATLFVGRGRPAATDADRTERIASGIKCPTCQGLSVAQSKASSARAIYSEISRQVIAGASDNEVRAYLVSRYGESQLLLPESSGAGSVVWIVPVMLAVLGAAGLVVAFRRSRPSGAVATEADFAVVRAAAAGGAARATAAAAELGAAAAAGLGAPHADGPSPLAAARAEESTTDE